MKKKSTSKSAFFNLRVLIAAVFCLAGIFVALLGIGAFSNLFAQTKGTKQPAVPARQDAPGTQTPDVVRLVGPVALNMNLRDLPYIPNEGENEGQRLTRYPFPLSGRPARSGTSASPQSQSLLEKILTPTSHMQPPLLTFDGTDRVGSGCNCRPPDTNGDVGPNHYVQTVNTGFRVFDKSGNPLTPFTTYNSFFAPLGTGNPCGNNQNDGDPIAFYDQIADRWVVSDFAFPSFPGPEFWQCIGVSQTPDPTGAYFLYALQVDPANPTFLGDYPKFALWNNPQPGGAYHLTVNLFNPSFQGVRVFALDRGSMLGGGPAHAIAFTLSAADVGASYSFVAATFRTGNPPPAGRDEFVLAIDSPATGGVTFTQVHGRLFHVDFAVPANSTFGIGPNHLPNAEITVNGFVDAFTNTTSNIVPQQGGQPPLDTLGDKIMTPVVYQNRNGTESLWADGTVCTDANCTGPTGVRWYQFNVTGGTFPATPVQQQTWTNGNDGAWRWMPAIAVDQNGNMAIGYSTSSPNDFPGIRYAGRFAGDPLNDLGQGEATLFSGTGSQTSASGRWGDYSMTTLDTDGISLWHTNEYYATTGSSWNTRVGKFTFPRGIAPTPRPRPTPPPRP